MFDAVIAWLDRVGPLVFWTCTVALVTLDTAALATVISTKSRALVNRWTGTVLAANLLLAGAGVGIPGAMYLLKLAVRTVAPSVSPFSTVKDQDARGR